MSFIPSIISLILLLWNPQSVENQQDCIKPADSSRRPIPFSFNSGTTYLPIGTQAIITSYKFRCCGRIAAWQVYVQPEPSDHQDEQYCIHFQIWRPLPTVEGCYSMVGFDRYTGSLGVKGLVSKVLNPRHNLEFQPGDVVGLFIFSDDTNTSAGGILLDRSYSDERVWFHTFSEDDPLVLNDEHLCPLPVGKDGRLNVHINAAPVIAVQLASFPCYLNEKKKPLLPTPRTSRVPVLPPPGFLSRARMMQKRAHDLSSRAVGMWSSGLTASIVVVCTVALGGLLLLAAIAAVRWRRWKRQKDPSRKRNKYSILHTARSAPNLDDNDSDRSVKKRKYHVKKSVSLALPLLPQGTSPALPDFAQEDYTPRSARDTTEDDYTPRKDTLEEDYMPSSAKDNLEEDYMPSSAKDTLEDDYTPRSSKTFTMEDDYTPKSAKTFTMEEEDYSPNRSARTFTVDSLNKNGSTHTFTVGDSPSRSGRTFTVDSLQSYPSATLSRIQGLISSISPKAIEAPPQFYEDEQGVHRASKDLETSDDSERDSSRDQRISKKDGVHSNDIPSSAGYKSHSPPDRHDSAPADNQQEKGLLGYVIDKFKSSTALEQESKESSSGLSTLDSEFRRSKTGQYTSDSRRSSKHKTESFSDFQNSKENIKTSEEPDFQHSSKNKTEQHTSVESIILTPPSSRENIHQLGGRRQSVAPANVLATKTNVDSSDTDHESKCIRSSQGSIRHCLHPEKHTREPLFPLPYIPPSKEETSKKKSSKKVSKTPSKTKLSKEKPSKNKKAVSSPSKSRLSPSPSGTKLPPTRSKDKFKSGKKTASSPSKSRLSPSPSGTKLPPTRSRDKLLAKAKSGKKTATSQSKSRLSPSPSGTKLPPTRSRDKLLAKAKSGKKTASSPSKSRLSPSPSGAKLPLSRSKDKLAKKTASKSKQSPPGPSTKKRFSFSRKPASSPSRTGLSSSPSRTSTTSKSTKKKEPSSSTAEKLSKKGKSKDKPNKEEHSSKGKNKSISGPKKSLPLPPSELLDKSSKKRESTLSSPSKFLSNRSSLLPATDKQRSKSTPSSASPKEGGVKHVQGSYPIATRQGQTPSIILPPKESLGSQSPIDFSSRPLPPPNIRPKWSGTYMFSQAQKHRPS